MTLKETLNNARNWLTGKSQELTLFSTGKTRGSQGESAYQRKPFHQLEKMYFMEPLVYAGVNFYVSQVVGTGFDLVEGSKRGMEEASDLINRIELEDKLPLIMQDCALYGNAFSELIANQDGELVNTVPLNPKNMEFIRGRTKNNSKKVIVDRRGNPIGYIQDVNTRDKDEFDRIVDSFDEIKGKPQYRGGIPFRKDDIAHFKWNELSRNQMGVGLIEPIYDTVDLKISSEESLENGLERAGFPLHIASLGNEDIHEPSQEEIEKFDEEALDSIEEKNHLTIPYFYDIEVIEPSKLDALERYLDYFVQIICTGMGIPHSILMKGERIGTGVSSVSTDQLHKNIKVRQRNLARAIENQIIRPSLKESGLDEMDIPRVEFRTLSPSVLTKKAERLSKFARAGILTPDVKLENEIRKNENLPIISEENRETKEARDKLREEILKNPDNRKAIEKNEKSKD